MTDAQYSSVGIPEVPHMAPQKPTPQHTRFARALSAAVAKRMQAAGLTAVYQLFRPGNAPVPGLPERCGVSPQTLYSTLYVASRPSVFVMRAVALALGTTLETLTAEADAILKRGREPKTVADVFRGKSNRGRPPTGKPHKHNEIRKREKAAERAALAKGQRAGKSSSS